MLTVAQAQVDVAGSPLRARSKAKNHEGEYKKETAPYIKSFSTEPISSAPLYSSESNGVAERLSSIFRRMTI